VADLTPKLAKAAVLAFEERGRAVGLEAQAPRVRFFGEREQVVLAQAALLGTGFSTKTQVPCTSTANVGGQLFSEQQLSSSLGPSPTFASDFAQGCSTAFAGLSRRLTNSALREAVGGFGIGAS